MLVAQLLSHNSDINDYSVTSDGSIRLNFCNNEKTIILFPDEHFLHRYYTMC